MPDLAGQARDSVQVLQAIRRVPVEWAAPKGRGTASPARLCHRDTGPALGLHEYERRIGKLPCRLLPKYPRGLPYPKAGGLYRTCFGLAILLLGYRRKLSSSCA